jgi:sulfopyruvate decarboxylase subunit alpha
VKKLDKEEDTGFNTLGFDRNAKADHIHRMLVENGVNFVSGVPCGVLRSIIRNVEEDCARIVHVPANRESEAVGLAAGAHLAGKTTMIYMQNSGLFSASNDIASLLIPYRIGTVMIVSYRGCDGEDAVQHSVTGGATEILLRSFGLPYAISGIRNPADLLADLFVMMRQSNLPVCLLLKRGWSK